MPKQKQLLRPDKKMKSNKAPPVCPCQLPPSLDSPHTQDSLQSTTEVMYTTGLPTTTMYASTPRLYPRVHVAAIIPTWHHAALHCNGPDAFFQTGLFIIPLREVRADILPSHRCRCQRRQMTFLPVGAALAGHVRAVWRRDMVLTIACISRCRL
jgi:hypothetical protein